METFDTQLPKGDYAIIHNLERAKEFRACGIDPKAVPIRSLIYQRVDLPIGSRRVYMLDLDRLTAEQRAALEQHLSRKFNLPIGFIHDELARLGMPILADEVTAYSTLPQKYL